MDEPEFELDGPQNTVSFWTTVNASEALPGIITPLNWSWYDRPAEYAQVGVFKALGVVPVSATDVPADPDRRFTTVFYGRYVINVDTWRRYADLTPGMSGEAVEKQFFGSARAGIKPVKREIRYASIAAKLPRTLLTAHRKSARLRIAIQSFAAARHREIPAAGIDRAWEIHQEAHIRFAEVQAHHLLCSAIAQMVYQNLTLLAEATGLPDICNSLTTGYGLEEAELQEQLWKISRNMGGSISDIIADHGFTGPGEIGRPSWREDPSIVQKLVDRFRALPEDRRPRLIVERQRQERIAAERQLVAALPMKDRIGAKLLLSFARKYMPLRESGRAALLAALDVGRASAHRIARILVENGVLRQAQDIFFLDLAEIKAAVASAGPADAQHRVDKRRERRDYYQTLSLPPSWNGSPTMAFSEAKTIDGKIVRGIPVTNASVTAIVRVVTDPADADDFEQGEILVCPMTDPSWASLFMLAAGVVIDIGGPLSHGAIVARELGVPCIINTKNGTTQLQTGMIVTIDGTAGTVTIIALAASPAALADS